MVSVTFLLMKGGVMANYLPAESVAENLPEYALKLFSDDKVHTIDIQIERSSWDAMIENAANEEYYAADLVIDGEFVATTGIRPKGNSSLSMIQRSDSDRYSFKVEFDHYISGQTFLGLDKLALNNIAQDNTYMKDYVAYKMMDAFGAYSPLCSFVNVTLNGEVWGLYLAVEGIEEAFAERAGINGGEIYKPESVDMGGRDGQEGQQNGFPQDGFPQGGFLQGEMPQDGFTRGEMPQNSSQPARQRDNGQRWQNGEDMPNEDMPNAIPPNAVPPNAGEWGGGAQDGQPQNFPQNGGFMQGGMRGGNSSVALKYIDNDPESYAEIFDNSVFSVTNADKARLISSLKKLSDGDDLQNALDINEVMGYFVVHNFVLNGDSYTGQMLHNYYLAENSGKLAMIAWDYNLAFSGMGSGDVNSSIILDLPDRPMVAWIFGNERYTVEYERLFGEFMEYFDSGEFGEMYDNAIELISPFVESDPTAFCSFAEFEAGQAALKQFCLARAESVKRQLAGDDAPVDVSGIDTSAMGGNMRGFNRGRRSADGEVDFEVDF
jgi:hypothetical protein